jgi:hypothetical protein
VQVRGRRVNSPLRTLSGDLSVLTAAVIDAAAMWIRKPAKRAVLVAVLLAVGTAACGGGAKGSGVASLSGHTATTRGGGKGNKKSFEDAMLEYARCMREHGIDMPDPTFDGDGGGKGFMIAGPGPGGGRPDEAKMKAATDACEPIMKRAEQDMPRPSPEAEAKMRDQALKFARCMREHGIDMPDPTFDGDGHVKVEIKREHGSDSASTDSGPTPVPDDPKFQTAMKACSKDGGPGLVTRGKKP